MEVNIKCLVGISGDIRPAVTVPDPASITLMVPQIKLLQHMSSRHRIARHYWKLLVKLSHVSEIISRIEMHIETNFQIKV